MDGDKDFLVCQLTKEIWLTFRDKPGYVLGIWDFPTPYKFIMKISGKGGDAVKRCNVVHIGWLVGWLV
jgi:hypothetical protein